MAPQTAPIRRKNTEFEFELGDLMEPLASKHK